MKEFMPSVILVVFALLGLLLFVVSFRCYMNMKSNYSVESFKRMHSLPGEFLDMNNNELIEDEKDPIGENGYKGDFTSLYLHDDDKVIASEATMFDSDHSCSNDVMNAYNVRFLSDCPIDEDGARVRINNDLLQKAKIILWFNPNVSVSSYVNNILRDHFRENQSVLEQRMNEVSASILDETL